MLVLCPASQAAQERCDLLECALVGLTLVWHGLDEKPCIDLAKAMALAGLVAVAGLAGS